MKRIAIIFISLLLASAIIAAVIAGSTIAGFFEAQSGQSRERVFVIKPGEGVNSISDSLYEQGLIKSKWDFEWYAWMIGENKFIAGEHKLNENMTIAQIASVLTSNPGNFEEYTVKILEGWNNREIAGYLEQGSIFEKDDFLKAAGYSDQNKEPVIDLSDDYEFLKDKKRPGVEGYIFPDTYRIYKEASPEDLVRKALNNFDKKLTAQMRDDIKKQGRSIYEIITLASIIEKEALTKEEKALVSSVFYNRLEIGMPLQSDATVNYATGKYERQPSYEDLETDSPYNTYKHSGLPPGPIGNPGIEAVKAAIYPADTDYLYFLHKTDGQIVLSKTYNEHIANKKKWLDR